MNDTTTETQISDVHLTDELNRLLSDTFTLADLLTSYHGDGATTSLGSAPRNAGYMMEESLLAAKELLDRWWEGKKAAKKAKKAQEVQP